MQCVCGNTSIMNGGGGHDSGTHRNLPSNRSSVYRRVLWGCDSESTTPPCSPHPCAVPHSLRRGGKRPPPSLWSSPWALNITHSPYEAFSIIGQRGLHDDMHQRGRCVSLPGIHGNEGWCEDVAYTVNGVLDQRLPARAICEARGGAAGHTTPPSVVPVAATATSIDMPRNTSVGRVKGSAPPARARRGMFL